MVSHISCKNSSFLGGNYSTGPDRRMSHRKWRESKQHPRRPRLGYQLGCCLVSLHFLCNILQSSPVQEVLGRKSLRNLVPGNLPNLAKCFFQSSLRFGDGNGNGSADNVLESTLRLFVASSSAESRRVAQICRNRRTGH